MALNAAIDRASACVSWRRSSLRAILRRCSVVSNVCLNGGGALVQPLPLACGDIDRGKRGGPHLAEDDDEDKEDGDELGEDDERFFVDA